VQGKVHPGDVYIVVGFEFFNTPGTEITPGSDVVGKYREVDGFAHAVLLAGAKVWSIPGVVAGATDVVRKLLQLTGARRESTADVDRTAEV
jgi:hypothetical protein